MNENRTCTDSDTPLTQRCSPTVLRDLIVKRNRVGRDTYKGRLLSNLIEQMTWREDGDRSWAKHPTQQMPWMMNVQVEALAKAK